MEEQEERSQESLEEEEVTNSDSQTVELRTKEINDPSFNYEDTLENYPNNDFENDLGKPHKNSSENYHQLSPQYDQEQI